MTNLGIPDFSLPNMDALTSAEIVQTVQVMADAADYGRCTVEARINREGGRITQALRWEKKAQAFYDRLPEDVRW